MTEAQVWLIVLTIILLVALGDRPRGSRRARDRAHQELLERARYQRWLEQQQARWELGGPRQMPLEQQWDEASNVIPWPLNPRARTRRPDDAA